MTKEEKELLVKDLCGRLPYWPDVKTTDKDKGYIIGIDNTEEGVFHVHILEDGDSYTCDMPIENFKPYLRPMSSMTEEERRYISDKCGFSISGPIRNECELIMPVLAADWLIDFYNEHHIDYRGFIEKGIALKAPENMYKEI